MKGRRILVTRPRAQAADLVEGFEALGAEVVTVPLIRITEPSNPNPLREAVAALESFDWIVFTSANAVLRFWTALRAAARDTGHLDAIRVCAIGPATAAEVAREGRRPDLVPEQHVAEGILAALEQEGVELSGKRILIPRSELARPMLSDTLRRRGAVVVDPPAYANEPEPEAADAVRRLLQGEGFDLVTFTSGSAVRNFAALIDPSEATWDVACIGPLSAAAAREAGFTVAVEAREFTVRGLIAAVLEHWRENG